MLAGNGMPDEERLFEEAIDIIIRLQNDPGNQVALDMAQDWCFRSPAHEAVWAEAVEIYGMTGRILTNRQGAGTERGVFSRRSLLIGGLIATGIAGTYAAPGVFRRAQADFTTRTAEIRRIELSDGTSVTLGPDSALAMNFSIEMRAVALLEGMAFFDVQKDRSRPFEVNAGGAVIHVVGTAFDVSAEAGSLTVTVDHGLVDVRPAVTGPENTVRIGAGDWLSINGPEISKGAREASQIAAWRDGMIIADREPVADAVAKIARWQSGKVFLASSALGRQRISGVFDLADPLSALEAVVHPYGGKIHRIAPYLIVIS